MLVAAIEMTPIHVKITSSSGHKDDIMKGTTDYLILGDRAAVLTRCSNRYDTHMLAGDVKLGTNDDLILGDKAAVLMCRSNRDNAHA